MTCGWSKTVNFVQSTDYDTADKDKNICNIVDPWAPFQTTGPLSFVPALQPPTPLAGTARTGLCICVHVH
jgi:hypothetical protein